MRTWTFYLIAALVLGGCKKDDDKPQTTTTGGGGGGQQTTLTAPALIMPPNGAGNIWTPITYSWGAVAGADYYEGRSWYYLNGGGQGTFTLSNSIFTSTSYTPAGALGDGFHGRTIYWHVRAFDGTYPSGVAGPWSETFSFTLQ